MLQNILPHLHYFWLVAKQLSFTKAAKVLRISQSAVSFQIKNLEEKLGVQLFLRVARNQVALSPQGLELYGRCQKIFQEVEAALHKLEGIEIQGELTITAPPNFGSFVLVSMLKILENKFPQLQVRLTFTESVVDIIKEGIDLAIRWGPTDDPKFSYEYVMHIQHILVASGQYVRTHPSIKNPKDIEKHRVILRKREPLMEGWKFWLAQFPSSKRPRIQGALEIESMNGMTVAVREGLGISVLPLYSTYDLLKEGRIVELLPQFNQHVLEPFYACYPRSPYKVPKITAFILTLKEYLKSCCGKKGFLTIAPAAPGKNTKSAMVPRQKAC